MTSETLRFSRLGDLNKERVAYLEKFPTLDENIIAAMKVTANMPFPRKIVAT